MSPESGSAEFSGNTAVDFTLGSVIFPVKAEIVFVHSAVISGIASRRARFPFAALRAAAGTAQPLPGHFRHRGWEGEHLQQVENA